MPPTTPSLPESPTSAHWEWCGRGCRSLAEAQEHEISVRIELLPPRVLCTIPDCRCMDAALWVTR